MLTTAAALGLMSLGVAPAAAADSCRADEVTACLQGTIRQSDGEPAEGVDLSIVGQGIEVVVTTDETGRWVLAVDTAGEYTITLDTETLPEGQLLSPDSRNPATVTAAFFKNSGWVFKLESDGSGDGGSSQGPASSAEFERFLQQAASGLRLGLLLALASVGLSLIYGTTGLSNFAHGEQVTFGGLVAFVAANLLGLNLIVAGLITLVVCAASGLAQDVFVWRPLRKRGITNTQLMIVTIGLSVALQYFFQLFFGAKTIRIDRANPVTVSLGPVSLSVQSLWAMGIAAIVIVVVGLFLLRSRIGRATRAVSDNPALAAASGIDVDRIIRLVWTASAALAGLAGMLLGLVLNGINWATGLELLLLMFAAVTLGGLGTAFGAFAGAMIIGMVVELTNLLLPGDFKYATALVILILILLIRPQGLFGRRERIG